MAQILDLSAWQEETADIRMQNGTVLHLRKPTQLNVVHILGMRNINTETPAPEIMRAIDNCAFEILNNNADGVRFTRENVAALDAMLKTRIISAYSEWAVELQSNPTTPSPASPAGAGRRRRRKNSSKLRTSSPNTQG